MRTRQGGIALFIILQVGCRAERREVTVPEPVILTDANFQCEVLDSPQVVLVEMWSATCQICVDTKPIVRELTAQLYGRVKIGVLNVDSNLFTAEKLGVSDLPVFLVFHDGKAIYRLEGRHTKDDLARLLESIWNQSHSTPPVAILHSHEGTIR